MGTNGKVAFITGGNRGLGLETARELGKQGFTVVLGARVLANGKDAVEQLGKEGITATVIHYDAAKPETDQSVFRQLEKTYGKLDVLVNNAGVMVEGFGLPNGTSTVSSAVLHETFEINFFAVVRLTQVLLPLLRKSEAGRIVNLSSILGSLTIHSAPNSPLASSKLFAYDASKTALNAFTVHLADELRDTAIKVNSAHPGWVKTRMGGPSAPLPVDEGGRTSAQLATLPASGPTGGFFHLGDALPW